MKIAFLKFRHLGLIALLLGVATAAFAADVDGVWTANFDTQIGELNYTYTFKADGEKLSGTAKNQYGENKIEDGVIKGKDITFTETVNFQGQTIVIKYTGTLDGDQINFTREVGTFATEKLVAKRQKAK